MNGKEWQDELQQPYRIVCDDQTYGYLADIYHALVIMKIMSLQGHTDIYLYQDDDVMPLFSTEADHALENNRDVLDARELVLFRIFQEVK